MSKSDIDKPPFYSVTEIPFNEKDATRRGIDPSLCRLIVVAKQKGGEGFLSIAQVIEAFRPPHKSIFVTSTGEFTSLDKIQFRTEAVEIFTQINMLKAANVGALKDVLSLWKAEGLVILLADDGTAKTFASGLADLIPRWWQYTREVGYEGPFLKQIQLCDPILFFSDSHMSLETIGSRQTIVGCFNDALTLL